MCCDSCLFFVFACASCSLLVVQIDGDVVFFDGTLFENLDEGVLCRYFQVNRSDISSVTFSLDIHSLMSYSLVSATAGTRWPDNITGELREVEDHM